MCDAPEFIPSTEEAKRKEVGQRKEKIKGEELTEKQSLTATMV